MHDASVGPDVSYYVLLIYPAVEVYDTGQRNSPAATNASMARRLLARSGTWPEKDMASTACMQSTIKHWYSKDSNDVLHTQWRAWMDRESACLPGECLSAEGMTSAHALACQKGEEKDAVALLNADKTRQHHPQASTNLNSLLKLNRQR